MTGVIVVGAGGHAKVCIELLRANGTSVDFCVGGPDSEAECLGVQVLQGDEHLSRLAKAGYSRVFIAIGNNRLRQKLGRAAEEMGYRLVNAISPAATVSPTVQLGEGIAIMGGAVVNASTVIADFAIINTCASVDHDCFIGEACHIAPQCGLAGNVQVGERTFLGIGSKVIPEITVGADVVAGAGSVIVTDVLEAARIAGVPARSLERKNT